MRECWVIEEQNDNGEWYVIYTGGKVSAEEELARWPSTPENPKRLVRYVPADTLAQGEWQPIETAPRNHQHILVWMPEILSTGLVVWRGVEWRHAFGGGKVHMQPTHWRPLPAPPQEDREP